MKHELGPKELRYLKAKGLDWWGTLRDLENNVHLYYWEARVVVETLDLDYPGDWYVDEQGADRYWIRRSATEKVPAEAFPKAQHLIDAYQRGDRFDPKTGRHVLAQAAEILQGIADEETP